MNNKWLITGIYSELLDDIVQETGKRGVSVVTTSELSDNGGTNVTYVPWSPSSLLSARSVVFSIDKQQFAIEHAVILCSCHQINSLLSELQSASIEKEINVSLKGILFILKEIERYFFHRGSGMITVLLEYQSPETVPPLSALYNGAIMRLVESMFQYYENAPVHIRGILLPDITMPVNVLVDTVMKFPTKKVHQWQKLQMQKKFFRLRAS